MTTKKAWVERWWFDMPCCFCAIMIVQVLLQAAGVDGTTFNGGFSFARLVVWGCCFYVVERLIKLALWAVVLVVAPQRAGEMP